MSINSSAQSGETLKKMKILPRISRESAREYALRVLRYNIVRLYLPPGALVSAHELSEVMGVSRTPIREAIQELNNSGLMKIYPQYGSRVSFIDYHRIHESRFIRMAIEAVVVELACEIAKPSDWPGFEEILQLEEYSLKSENFDKLLEHDDRFHCQFYVVTDKMMAYKLLETVQDHFDRVRLLSIRDSSVNARVVKEHWKLFDAVKAGDKATARAVVDSHLSSYLDDERMIRDKYREYFAE
jgi:DNA-binding GntR family transcriptional regulator